MRLAAGLCAVVTWWGCRDLTVAGPPSLVIDPVLDSLFVGDVSLRPSVIYYDGAGGSRIPAPTEIHWACTDTATLGVDSVTGRMTARLPEATRLLMWNRRKFRPEVALV